MKQLREAGALFTIGTLKSEGVMGKKGENFTIKVNEGAPRSGESLWYTHNIGLLQAFIFCTNLSSKSPVFCRNLSSKSSVFCTNLPEKSSVFCTNLPSKGSVFCKNLHSDYRTIIMGD
jgi:hypothetical protein